MLGMSLTAFSKFRPSRANKRVQRPRLTRGRQRCPNFVARSPARPLNIPLLLVNISERHLTKPPAMTPVTFEWFHDLPRGRFPCWNFSHQSRVSVHLVR